MSQSLQTKQRSTVPNYLTTDRDQRKTDHQHLFLGQQMDSDGIAMVGKVPRPEDIQRLLVEGHPDIPGSGWGEIEDLTVDFLHSGMAMQVSTADLDDAGDGEGNGGRQDYPSPYGVIW